jgi:mRNA interferase MazF
MNPGDVVLIRLGQAGGGPVKLRPALVLSLLPGPYQNVLICGISSQLHQLEANWDELVQAADPDFKVSGLHRTSSVRLSYLYAADHTEIAGTIGLVDSSRLARLRSRLRQNLL